jgi:hypothetical protein
MFFLHDVFAYFFLHEKLVGETAITFPFLNFVLHAETVLEGFDKTTPGKDLNKSRPT